MYGKENVTENANGKMATDNEHKKILAAASSPRLTRRKLIETGGELFALPNAPKVRRRLTRDSQFFGKHPLVASTPVVARGILKKRNDIDDERVRRRSAARLSVQSAKNFLNNVHEQRQQNRRRAAFTMRQPRVIKISPLADKPHNRVRMPSPVNYGDDSRDPALLMTTNSDSDDTPLVSPPPLPNVSAVGVGGRGHTSTTVIVSPLAATCITRSRGRGIVDLSQKISTNGTRSSHFTSPIYPLFAGRKRAATPRKQAPKKVSVESVIQIDDDDESKRQTKPENISNSLGCLTGYVKKRRSNHVPLLPPTPPIDNEVEELAMPRPRVSVSVPMTWDKSRMLWERDYAPFDALAHNGGSNRHSRLDDSTPIWPCITCDNSTLLCVTPVASFDSFIHKMSASTSQQPPLKPISRDALSAAFKFLTNEYGASYSIRRQYKAVADLLATSKRTHQLWYHALTPLHYHQLTCMTTNVESVCEWLQLWPVGAALRPVHRHKGLSDKPPKPPTNVDIVTSRRRKGKTTSNDDFIVDDYCDDSDEDGVALRRRPNPMIVYGPRGHGKTALVHALANTISKQSGTGDVRVLTIGADERRTRALLDARCQGATVSRRLPAASSPSTLAFFSPRPKSHGNNIEEVQKMKHSTILLFEDVDTCFGDEDTFLAHLPALVEQSMVPVVVTLTGLPSEQLTFVPPYAQTLIESDVRRVQLLAQVCALCARACALTQLIGLAFANVLFDTISLNLFVDRRNGDVRRVINDLQMFLTTQTIQTETCLAQTLVFNHAPIMNTDDINTTVLHDKDDGSDVDLDVHRLRAIVASKRRDAVMDMVRGRRVRRTLETFATSVNTTAFMAKLVDSLCTQTSATATNSYDIWMDDAQWPRVDVECARLQFDDKNNARKRSLRDVYVQEMSEASACGVQYDRWLCDYLPTYASICRDECARRQTNQHVQRNGARRFRHYFEHQCSTIDDAFDAHERIRGMCATQLAWPVTSALFVGGTSDVDDECTTVRRRRRSCRPTASARSDLFTSAASDDEQP